MYLPRACLTGKCARVLAIRDSTSVTFSVECALSLYTLITFPGDDDPREQRCAHVGATGIVVYNSVSVGLDRIISDVTVRTSSARHY